MINETVIVLFGVTLIFISTTSRLGTYVKMLSIQGVLIFLISITHLHSMETFHALFITFETLGVKALLIPLFIGYIIQNINIIRETEANIHFFTSLLISTLIIVGCFMISFFIAGFQKSVDVVIFGPSIAAIIVGLFIIVTRKKLITHVMGYLVMENGIFLLSLALATDVPIIVEVGVLLDIFIGVFLMGIFLNKIQSTLESSDIQKLSQLTD
jgi:hydrogenase-4 component E